MIHVRLPFRAVVEMTCGLEAACAIHGGFKPPLLNNFPVSGGGRDARATWRGHLARSLQPMALPKFVPSLSAHRRCELLTNFPDFGRF